MKKQLNYKSLNTLGDVDITQSVVPGGGEAESGDWHYFDVSGCENTTKLSALQTAMMHKAHADAFGASIIMPTGFGYMIPIDAAQITAIATDFTTKIQIGEQILTVGESITKAPWYGTVPEITKEEFYKLPVVLKIYTYSKGMAAHQYEMKTAFDTLWAIWERDGVEGEELAITIPNADIASITFVTYDGEEGCSPTSMMGGTTTSTSDTVTYIELNGQYGPQIRKVENLNTGEITYEYYYQA